MSIIVILPQVLSIPLSMKSDVSSDVLKDEAQHADNLRHILDCKETNCPRCWFTKSHSQLQSITPLLGCLDLDEVMQARIKAALPKSWLKSCTTDSGWGVGCRLCFAAGVKRGMGEFKCGRGAVSALQSSNLVRHAGTETHKLAAVAYVRKLGLTVSDGGLVDNFAPDLASFLKALEVAKRGGNAGELPFGDQKFKQMVWCLAEAAWQPHRQALSKADVIGLFRDERAGHLLVRATAIGPDLVLHHFVLGIKSRFGTGALNVSDATRTIMQRVGSLKWAQPGQTSPTEPGFDGADLFAQFAPKVRCVAVDSASDEVVSALDMVEGSGYCTGIECVLRDKAHASRRCLTRPWTADTTINDLLQFFVRDPQSLLQKIDHSPNLRDILSGHIEKIKTGVISHSHLVAQ